MKIITKLSVFFALFFQSFAQTTEETLKSLYISHFANYTAWPKTSTKQRTSYTIGYYGDINFLLSMEETFKIRGLHNKQVKIKKIIKPGDSDNCDIIVINNKKEDVINLLSYIQDKPILTISDEETLYRSGVMITMFKNDENQLRFYLNIKALSKAKLKVSSELIKFAVLIK